MNAPAPLSVSRQSLARTYAHIRTSRFVADRLSVGITIAALLINLVTFMSLTFTVHPALQGAVRYSSLSVGYTLGSWYYPYVVGLFALGVTLVNLVLAYRVFGRSRLASFFLVSASLVVGLFALIIANALGGAR